MKTSNRWLILALSVVINMAPGCIYAWSVFQKPLMIQFNWSTTETSLAFTICLLAGAPFMILAGKVQDTRGPKVVLLVGGLMLGLGVFLAGLTQSLAHLYITYGCIAGIGQGVIYAGTVANAIKWFPDRRGLASGIAVAGFSTGAIVVAPLATMLIQDYGVLTTFKLLGLAYLITVYVCALFIKAPPIDYRPEGCSPHAYEAFKGAAQVKDKDWKQMLSDPMFYVLWGMLAIGASAGLMIIGHASPIGQELARLTPQAAAAAVGFLAVANTFGRIVWGWISDKIGRYLSCIVMYLTIGIGLCFLGNVMGFISFVANVMVIGLCYGGLVGIFPSMCADMFGARNLGQNYGIMFTAYNIGGFIGPSLAAQVRDLNNGNYVNAFYIAAVLCFAGILLSIAALWIGRRRNQLIVKLG